MIFELLKHLHADLWFCFDGFCYGCECMINECTKDSMNLVLRPEYIRKCSSVLKQLPLLFQNPSAPLSRAELHVYFPRKFAKELNSSTKIILITGKNPEFRKHGLNGIEIQLINLRGASKQHIQQWDNITSYEFKSGFDNF